MRADILAVARNIVNQIGDLWAEKIPSEKWVPVRQATNDRLDEFTAGLIETVAERDEFHTMDELYDYRMLYNALAFNAMAKSEQYTIVKSWHHSDGEKCFGGGWFIVVAMLPTGQVSNHYKAEHWNIFQVPAVDLPPVARRPSPDLCSPIATPIPR